LKRFPRWFKRGALGLFVAGALVFGWVLLGLPSRSEVRDLAGRIPAETSVMRQRETEAKAGEGKPRRLQTRVPLRSISRNLIHAVLAAEDPSFFGHAGLDWEAIRESIELNIEKGRFARGGSTITQQLAKNVFFTTHKSLIRKVREAIVTGWMERDLSKERIIELYLNVIEWGDGIYGCEAAARRYYGTACAALSVDQAAGLAAMIPSPLRINPRANPGLHARATRRVLRQMRGTGYLRRQIRGIGAEPAKAPPADPEIPAPTSISPS